MQPESNNTGLVMRINRRLIEIVTDRDTIFSGKTSSQLLDIGVGDRVSFAERSSEIFVTRVLQRKNCLKRLYREEERLVASNVDHLLIVAAVDPLFQTLFVDRILAVANHQAVPCSLILNKKDLGLESAQASIETYQSLGIPVFFTSAKCHSGLEELQQFLLMDKLRIVALGGISGVGKSSLLNCLIPEAERKTGSVSDRSGKGKQTTSQACGYLYSRLDSLSLLLIDLPGIQHFGVGHLKKSDILQAFPEIYKYTGQCEYQDCYHEVEKNCSVKEALRSGNIAASRYDSYVKMLAEVAAARKY